MKSKTFDHLTVQWTVQDDKRNVDVVVLIDNLLAAKGSTIVNAVPFSWNTQVNLAKTSGYISACMIPSDGIVNLQIAFRTTMFGKPSQLFNGQLDKWQV